MEVQIRLIGGLIHSTLLNWKNLESSKIKPLAESAFSIISLLSLYLRMLSRWSWTSINCIKVREIQMADWQEFLLRPRTPKCTEICTDWKSVKQSWTYWKSTASRPLKRLKTSALSIYILLIMGQWNTGLRIHSYQTTFWSQNQLHST